MSDTIFPNHFHRPAIHRSLRLYQSERKSGHIATCFPIGDKPWGEYANKTIIQAGDDVGLIF